MKSAHKKSKTLKTPKNAKTATANSKVTFIPKGGVNPNTPNLADITSESELKSVLKKAFENNVLAQNSDDKDYYYLTFVDEVDEIVSVDEAINIKGLSKNNDDDFAITLWTWELNELGESKEDYDKRMQYFVNIFKKKNPTKFEQQQKNKLQEIVDKHYVPALAKTTTPSNAGANVSDESSDWDLKLNLFPLEEVGNNEDKWALLNNLDWVFSQVGNADDNNDTTGWMLALYDVDFGGKYLNIVSRYQWDDPTYWEDYHGSDSQEEVEDIKKDIRLLESVKDVLALKDEIISAATTFSPGEDTNVPDKEKWQKMKKKYQQAIYPKAQSAIATMKAPSKVTYIPEIQKLLDEGGVNAKDKSSATPLHFAAQSQPSAIQPLIDAGADVNTKNKFGWTPLHYASKHHASVIKELIDAGADVNAQIPTSNRTPLHLAAQYQPSAIQPLTDAGADVNAKDESGWTPLHDAAQSQPSAIQPLIDAGTDVNAKDEGEWTPLHYAAQQQPSAIQLLIDAGADVNAETDEGATPLHLAAQYQPTAIQPLIANGANVNAKDEDNWTPLHVAAQYQPTAIQPLIAASVNVNAKDENDYTPLHVAAQYQPSAIQPLINAGADVNAKNANGKTPLDLATTKEAKDFLQQAAPAPDVLQTLISQSNKYIASLSQHSKQIVTKYTGNSYKGMNKCLRKMDTKDDKACNAELSDLDRILVNGPKSTYEITLLRSFNPNKNSESKTLMETFNKLKPGDIFEERAFMSTAYDIPADDFIGNKCCIMRIKVPPGVNMLAVESISHFGKKEREILLTPGMGLMFTGTSLDNKNRTVYDFTCEYCLPSQRFRQSVAPTEYLNVTPYKPPNTRLLKPLVGTQRWILSAPSAKDLKQFSDHHDTIPATGYTTKELQLPSFMIVDFIVSVYENQLLDDIDEYYESQPIFVRGNIDNTYELEKIGFKIIASNSKIKWLARGTQSLPVLKTWSLMNDDVLVVDFISPESKIRPSTRKQKEEITAKSQRIYGILGEPSQLEKYLGCSLFRDGCIKEFTNFDTNTRYEVTQPLKQYLLLARHHLCKLMGKYVVFPTLSSVNDIPYLISGTTAINYWIQTLAGGKEYKLPIIPTEDFDIKLDMKYTPQIEKLLTDKLLIETKRIFNDMQKYSNLKITDITYEWTGATDTLRRLIAKIELPQLLAQTGQSRLMFPVIEFSFHTGIKHLDDKRYLLPYLGIYLATPEYIRDDMCKGWNQFYKSERRQAKMAYWNLVFPEGHRLHQSNKFNVKNTDSCPN